MARIWLAGEEATATWVPRLDRLAAARRPDAAAEAARHAAPLVLREAPDEKAELDRRLELLRAYGVLRLDDLAMPRGRGISRGLAALRQALWRLLRHPLDQVAVRQNAVNRQLLAALESALTEQRREIAALRGRVAALESARREPPGGTA